MLVAGLVAGLLLGGVINLALPRSYTSEAKIFLGPTHTGISADAAWEGNQLSTQKAKSYVELLTSNRMGEEVVRRLGPNFGLDAAAVANDIKASSSQDTVVINIAASGSSAQRAQELADACVGSAHLVDS